MDPEKNRQFVERVEELVQPEDVNAISFLGDVNRIFPIPIQNRMVKKGTENAPYMGFIVDPYCFFLTYELTDTERAKSYLPKGYELVPIQVFKGEEERHLLVIGTFSARTSAFTGIRSEFYLIAREIATGITSWMIIDYETNTNTYDPTHGFSGYSLTNSYFTTTSHGELLLRLNSKEKGEVLKLHANLKKSKTRKLASSLWLEHNYHTDYGPKLRGSGDSVFSLVFDPQTMLEAEELNIEDVEITSMKLYDDIIDSSKPVNILTFPYSQHYFIEYKDPTRHSNTQEIEGTIDRFLTLEKLKRMSGDALKKPIKRSLVISLLINLTIITTLIIKLL